MQSFIHSSILRLFFSIYFIIFCFFSLDGNVGLLTNYEVFQHIKSFSSHNYSLHQNEIIRLKSSISHSDSMTGSQRADFVLKLTNLELKSESIWLSNEIIKYLLLQPCKEQSEENISNFIFSLTEFLSNNNLSLTNTEILQLINHRPTQLVEIHRIIEECEERLGEEDTLAVLDLIQKHMKTGNNNEEDNENSVMETTEENQ